MANVGTLVNNGNLIVNTGATLNLTNQLNVTDVPYGTGYQIYGTFNAGPNNAFASLTSIEGYVYLENGQTTGITPNGGVLTLSNTGRLDFGNSSIGTITGDVNNSGFFSTGYQSYDYTGSTVTVTGNFTNNQNAALYLYDPNDVVNVGTLANNGYLYIGPGATLNLTNQPGGITDVPYQSQIELEGTINDVVNTASGLANLTSVEGLMQFQNNGQTNNITPGGGLLTVSNTGHVDFGNSSNGNINGDVNNSGFFSTGYYYGNPTGATVNVTGTFTNNPNSYLYLYDSNDVVNIGTLVNNGYVYIGFGAALNLTNQLNVTDVPAGSGYEIQGTFNAGANNAFASLTSIEGYVYLQNGQTTSITPNGGTLTLSSTGQLDAGNSSTISVNGSVDNSGFVSTSRTYGSSTGSTLNVTGTFTNEAGGTLYLYDSLDVANIGSLANNGEVYISPGATLNLTTQLNVTDVPSTASYYIYGNFNNNGLNSPFGGLTTVEGLVVLGNGQTVNNTPGGGALIINSGGRIDVSNGSTLNVNGDLTNGNLLGTNNYSQNSNVSTIAVTGTLINNNTMYLYYASNVSAGNFVNNNYVEQYDYPYVTNTVSAPTITNNGSIYQYDYYGYYTPSSNTMTASANLINNGYIQQYGYYGKNTIQTPVLDNAGTITQYNYGLYYYGYPADLILVGTGIPTAQGYDQLANGTLNEHINLVGGNGVAGVINIMNGAPINLAGTLDLILQSGYNPTAGTSFDILVGTAGQLFGTFSTVLGDIFNGGSEYWLIDYDPNGFVQITATCVVTNCATTEYWNGGTGTWSNPGKWSTGAVPTINDDTTIYSGGSDLVTLDTAGSAKSLTLGGTYNGFQSELTDGGVAQTLTIANELFVGQSGFLNLSGGTAATAGADSINAGTIYLANASSLAITGNMDNQGVIETFASGNTFNATGTMTNESGADFILGGTGDSSSLGGLVNNGYVNVGTGATLNLTNQPSGITDAVAGSTFSLFGTFTAGSNPGFANLNSVGGTVNLFGQSFAITPGSGTFTNTGTFNVDSNPDTSTGSAITINGDVLNSGDFFTGDYYGSYGASTVTINGNVTNNGNFWEFGQGYSITAQTLTNNGYTYVGPSNTLTLTNQPAGITDAVAGSRFDLYGTFNAGANPGFANLTSVEGTVLLFGQSFTMTPGTGTLTISNTGFLDVDYNPYTATGSNMTINGNVNNSGALFTGAYYGGPSTLTITGGLTNNYGADFYLQGNGDQGFVATLLNDGNVYVGPGATLTLTSQPGGITDVVQGSRFSIWGTFNAGSSNAFAGLTSVEGTLIMANGQTTSITPSGGTFTVSNTGHVDASFGSTINVNGNVSNGGTLSTGFYGGGGNQFNITGTLTNQPGSAFNMYGNGDTASVGSLVNQGSMYIGPGTTFDPMRVDNYNLIQDSGTMVVGTGTPGGQGYYQFANGTLGEHISMSQFGVVAVGASIAVSLNGTLDIQLASGFNPSVGTSYDIITFTSGDLTGSFSSVLNDIFNNGTEKWGVIYNNSGGYVELLAQSNVSTVPEPSSFLLLGTGLIGFSVGLRRRMSR